MASNRGSKEGDKHPYMRAIKWGDGTLCFWRDRPNSITKRGIEYFENFVIEQMESQKNVATIDPNLK